MTGQSVSGWAHTPSSFRQAVLRYAHRSAEGVLSGKTPKAPKILGLKGKWTVELKVFRAGKLAAEGGASVSDTLAKAIGDATAQAFDEKPDAGIPEPLKGTRFFITLSGAAGVRSGIIEYKGKALEAVGDVAAARVLTPGVIKKTIALQKNYLLAVMHPEYHGFYKKYDARTDRAEKRLRTIYTASSLFTLLKIQDYDRDRKVLKLINPITDFLSFMQVKEGENEGAFHYSLDPDTGAKEQKFVVGTASKTIFTLLELYKRTGEGRYFDSAVGAGKWLLKRVDEEGRVSPIVKLKEGKWVENRKFSFLYSGQVLSAISRLYGVTHNAALKETAGRVAARIRAQAEKDGFFAGDDFRPPNTISTSWAALSMLDYWYISQDPVYADAVFKCADQILLQQKKDPADLLTYGRFDTFYSSGNGWINEVMVEVYKLCSAQGRGSCGDYLDSILRTTRWLVQNVYTDANTFHLPNPEKARGGAIRNDLEENVRTDAVCHGVNSLVGVLQIAGRSAKLSAPELSWEDYRYQILG